MEFKNSLFFKSYHLSLADEPLIPWILLFLLPTLLTFSNSLKLLHKQGLKKDMLMIHRTSAYPGRNLIRTWDYENKYFPCSFLILSHLKHKAFTSHTHRYCTGSFV